MEMLQAFIIKKYGSGYCTSIFTRELRCAFRIHSKNRSADTRNIVLILVLCELGEYELI